MKHFKKKTVFLLPVLLVLLSSCNNQAYAQFKIPNEHQPSEFIMLGELSDYTMAYCVDTKVETVHLVVASVDQKLSQVLTTDNLRIQPSPYITKPQTGHPIDDDVGCISSTSRDIRFNTHEFFWKPNSKVLAFVSGSDPFSADYHAIEFQADLTYSEIDPPITFHDYNKYFISPRWFYWSPNAQRFATLGLNTQAGNTGSNIWVYDIPTKKLQEVTHFTNVGNDVATAAWSSNSKLLAIGYGGPASGIAIASLGEQKQYLEISSNTDGDLLPPWPHWLTSSLFNVAKALYYGNDSIEVFNGALAFNSTPVWVNDDQQVIFVGANSKNKAALFIVNADGSNLHELLPGLPGIVLLPQISPDGNLLAFARFPDWSDRSRVEIATLDLTSMTINSLAVFPKPSDGSILFVSGMDWSPDGKYLAVSVPYNNESDIFIFSRDGTSWINFTEDLDGDALSPVWKPSVR